MNRQKAFGLLGIVPGDSLETVKAKYRMKAKQCHPDRFAHDHSLMKAAEVEMTQINLAYQVACAQLESANDFGDPVGNTVSKDYTAPWLSLIHWSMDHAKPLLQKAMGFLYFQPGHGMQSSHPEKSFRKNYSHTQTSKESFDTILQRKVEAMKQSRHNKKS